MYHVISDTFHLQYTLPACLRLIEHLHVVEILRDAEDERQRLLSELRIIAELQSQSEPVIVDHSALENGSNDPSHNSVKGLASRPSFTRGTCLIFPLVAECTDRRLIQFHRIICPCDFISSFPSFTASVMPVT